MKLFKTVTLLLLAFLFVKADAQTTEDKKVVKEEKKVVIISKTIDKDGTEVVEKIVKDGEDADNVIIIDEDGEEVKIEVKNMGDGSTKEIKIIVDDEDLDKLKDVDIIKDLDEEMIQTIDVTKGKNGNEVKIIMKSDDGENDFEWEGDGEMPEDIKKQLEEKGIKIEELEDGNFFSVTYDGEEDLHLGHDNKAFLGVQIGDTDEITNEKGIETVKKSDSAEILGITEGSAAEEAGLKKGDIMTAIDGKAIKGFKDVVEILGSYEVGDKIKIDYTRDGNAQSTEATLKGAEKQKVVINKWIDKEGNDFEFKEGDGNVFFFSEDEDREHKIIKKKNKVIIIDGDGEQEITIKNGDGEGNVFFFSDEDGNKKIVKKKKVIIIEKDGKKEKEITEEIEIEGGANENELNDLDIEIYPNPTDGVLKLNFKTKAAPTVISVTDLSGKEVYKKELQEFKGEFNEEIDLKNATKGVLILTITQGKKSFTEKIILG